MEARIASLHIYPLKSAGGIALETAPLRANGFPLDRRWMLVDGDGRFLSQRRVPKMALLSTLISADHLQIDFPGLEPLTVPLTPPTSGPRDAIMHRSDERIAVLDEGENAANWMVEALGNRGQPRLVRIDPDFRRPIPDDVAGEIELSDGYPYLVASTASLALLNDGLIATGVPEAPVDMARFRPNIVLDLPEPWVEMQTGSVLLDAGGQPLLDLVKPCQRCTIPQVDPASGERDLGPELHRVLKQLSARAAEPGNHFGQNAVPREGALAELRVGQMLLLDRSGAT